MIQELVNEWYFWGIDLINYYFYPEIYYAEWCCYCVKHNLFNKK